MANVCITVWNTIQVIVKAIYLESLGIDQSTVCEIYTSGIEVNGMGGKGLTRFVPDWFPALLPKHCLEAIGDWHDYQYAVAKDSRARIDAEFRRLIFRAGKGKGIITRARLLRIGWMYWAGVRVFGGRHYNEKARLKNDK